MTTFQEEARDFISQNPEIINYLSKFGSPFEKAVAKTFTDAAGK